MFRSVHIVTVERIYHDRVSQQLVMGDGPVSCPQGWAGFQLRRGGGGWQEAMVLVCFPLAGPIGLSHVLVVSTEPLDDLSCLTTPGRLSQRRAVARAVDQMHPDAHSESMLGLPTPALTCTHWGVHLQDNFPYRGF